MEVSTEAPNEPKAEPDPLGGDNSLANLFSQEEEEENPLASLINALPNVAASELMDDLQEIRDIIEQERHN